jgi:hypothetical protein
MGVSVTKEKAIPMQLKKLRAAFVNESGLALHRCLWAATKAPYEIRDGAIRDLTKAHKACREKKTVPGRNEAKSQSHSGSASGARRTANNPSSCARVCGISVQAQHMPIFSHRS